MDPVVAHLADCGHCRTSTAALLRLEAEFADVPVAARESSEGSAGLTEALSSWFSKLFGSSAEGVFAHGERSEKDAKKDTAAADDGSDNDDADRT
ncbi:MAG: hypothetical protein UZ17_ACD001001630 [Acidobacteria bacterium OLB17]|nr:MAG: hypothetical protein UZ17_ACD001001630 [Acidobacteria bacterium OLB17]